MGSFKDRIRNGAKNAGELALMATIACGALFLVSLLFVPGFYIWEENAVVALSKEGWSDVEVVSSHWLSPKIVGGCGNDDDTAFEVVGVNPAGKNSDATVCCSLLWKGCTVRH